MGFFDPVYDPFYDYDKDGKLDFFETEDMIFDDMLILGCFDSDETESKPSVNAFVNETVDEFDPFEFDPLLTDFSEKDTNSEPFGNISINKTVDEFDPFEFDPMYDDIEELDFEDIFELLLFGIIDEDYVRTVIPDFFG